MRKILFLFATLVLATSIFATDYKLVKVTDASGLEYGGMYVFERNSRALIASVKNNVLLTTDSFQRAALQGTEMYVWELVAKDASVNPVDSFIIRTKGPNSGHTDLGNPSGKTDMSMAGSPGPAWRIAFENEVALISNLDNSKRFLGEETAGSGTYRAYAASNLANYGHDFTVWKLEAMAAGEPYLTVKPASANFGIVENGASVTPIELEVLLANLSGTVSYDGLSAPFSASGTITASGQKITISATPTAAGSFNQTLTIHSSAGDVAVPVSMQVEKSAADYQFSHDFTQITGFSSWGNSYAKHKVEYATPGDSVIFESANKQGSNITNMPVTKGKSVQIVLTNKAKAFKAIQFVCQQWNTLAQTITLWYSTDGGANYSKFSPSITATNFVIKAADILNTVDAIKITFSNTSNQVGIKGVYFDLQDNANPPTPIDNAEITEKAVKTIENGQIVIIKNGQKYNVQGQAIR